MTLQLQQSNHKTTMEFNFTNDRPIYIQLVEYLELYIISGQFSPGEKLPSVRDLAFYAKVNPNTMQRALQELEDKKLIITMRTNGKFVTDDEKFLTKQRENLASIKIQKFLNEMQELGLSRTQIINYLQNIKGKD